MVTDEFLDRMRHEGDPPADDAAATLLGSGGFPAMQRLLDQLVSNDDVIPGELPEEVRAFLATPMPGLSQQQPIREGQELFANFGPEMLMILCFYSLPAAYAARKGVQVLHRTAFLKDRPNLRLVETTQLVVDVLVEGGLEPKGKGLVTTKKVRLMHAAVRRLLTRPGQEWPTEFGLPINQEDLAGTLMTFSWLVLDGLRMMGHRLERRTEDAYLQVWQFVGTQMGVRDELIPKTLNDAQALTATIQRRQIARSVEGAQMTGALLRELESTTPDFLDGFPSALMRFFLPRDVADDLGIPPAVVEQVWSRVGLGLIRWLDVLVGGPGRRRVFRHVSLFVIQALLKFQMHGRAQFRLPTALQQDWMRPYRRNADGLVDLPVTAWTRTGMPAVLKGMSPPKRARLSASEGIVFRKGL